MQVATASSVAMVDCPVAALGVEGRAVSVFFFARPNPITTRSRRIVTGVEITPLLDSYQPESQAHRDHAILDPDTL